MPANNSWSITFGAYAFAVDRRDLTYRLTETETGTVWADGASLGTIEITNRETGETIPYRFGEMKLISLSEKSGATGKRILFGLDAPGGIPVDVYLTCTEREIQVTVEASRDTRTHRVGGFILLPSLCSVPDDGTSHLVIPYREGAILFAKDLPAEPGPYPFPIWDAEKGLTMPFVGAVRVNAGGATPTRTALALLTDSAYGVADLFRSPPSITLDLRYERDPERRRLDVRVVPLPGGDHVSVARAYRDKIIGDGAHISLRKKMRDKPDLVHWLDGDQTARDAKVLMPYLAQQTNRWQAIDDAMKVAKDVPSSEVSISTLSGDWATPLLDIWFYLVWQPLGITVPLLSVVHHDTVPICIPMGADEEYFLRALLYIAPLLPSDKDERIVSILRPLHRLSLGAFLTAHRFLTPDFAVEEAVYSDGARIVINQSMTDDYVGNDLHLPPLGFYVAHKEMVAHHAVRVGGETFDGSAWRVRRARDGKPLADSGDVLVEESPVVGLGVGA